MYELDKSDICFIAGGRGRCHCHYTAPGVDVNQVPQGRDKDVSIVRGLPACTAACQTLGYGWVILRYDSIPHNH